LQYLEYSDAGRDIERAGEFPMESEIGTLTGYAFLTLFDNTWPSCMPRQRRQERTSRQSHHRRFRRGQARTAHSNACRASKAA
jgi:hypothetical protein